MFHWNDMPNQEMATSNALVNQMKDAWESANQYATL